MTDKPWEVTNSQKGFEGKTIQDFLVFEGMFNPVLRFAFTNVLNETFTSKWNGVPYNVAPNQTVKLPHHLAAKFTKEIVDKMMQDDKKSSSMGIPEMRRPYEDKVLRFLPDEQSNELEIIKNEFIEQVNRDANRPANEADNQSPAESLNLNFEDLQNKIVTSEAPETPKRGRPAKK